jgi:1-acyl-sn-glycerol-3-phosphate acyltransferase
MGRKETSLNVLRSLLFYMTLFFSTFVLGCLAITVAMVSRRSDAAHLIARCWANVNLWGAGVKVRVTGLEHINPNTSYVYAANHQSWFDIFALLGKLSVQFRWLAKIELFKIPVLGRAMAACGYIPIDRGNRRKAFESLNLAAERIREGTSVVIFPEGTRSPDGVLQEFKKGGFLLAIQSQHPIVPISIRGTHRILPKRGEWRIHPNQVLITINKPIPTEGLTAGERDELIDQVREAIRAHLTIREGGVVRETMNHPVHGDHQYGS